MCLCVDTCDVGHCECSCVCLCVHTCVCICVWRALCVFMCVSMCVSVCTHVCMYGCRALPVKRVFITKVKGTFLGMSESEEASKRR